MKSLRYLMIIFVGFLLLSCAKRGTYSLYIRYQPLKDLSSLQQKIGSSLGIVPFKDERSNTLYIGVHIPLQGVSSHFKSDPFPLEEAITESLSDVLSRQGIKTVPIPKWDEKPESLQEMETDSILTIHIKKFWIEGEASLFRTNVKTSIHLTIHLGIKKEGKVFTRNVEVEKEITVARLTPERMGEMVNQILTDVFDSFLSNPY